MNPPFPHGQAMSEQADLTRTLDAIDQGDAHAASSLLPLVYSELRRRAGNLMAEERSGHTLTPTALVHEAYAKLAGQGRGFEGRRHFFNAVALAMRQILVDHARTRGRLKRGGAAARINIDSIDVAVQPDSDLDWLVLEE